MVSRLSQTQQVNLKTALITMLEDTSVLPPNAERFFWLLHLSALLKPEGARHTLRLLLAGGAGAIGI